jgi:Flp pilus assembly pilin Flp
MLAQIKSQITEFVQDDAGLSATEYAILFVVLIVFIVAAIRILGPRIEALFNRAGAALDGAN